MMGNEGKVKVVAKAKYGLVGNSIIPVEIAMDSLRRAGYEPRDLGDGILEFDMFLDPDNPMVKELSASTTKTSFSVSCV